MSDVQEYCTEIGLSEDAISILLSHRFDTLTKLKLLTDAVIKEEFRDMPLADRLTLADAMRKLNLHDEPSNQPEGASSGAEAQQVPAKQPTAESAQGGQPTKQPTAESAQGGQPTKQPAGSGRTLIREEVDPKEKNYCMILIGRTGAGKSSTGNTILGKPNAFAPGSGWGSKTARCMKKGVVINGRTVDVLDTPGVCDTERSETDVAKEISRAVILSHPGPHVFLLTFKVSERFTGAEFDAYEKLKGIFGEDVKNYTIIVFTGGDMLETSQPGTDKVDQLKKAVDEKIAHAPPKLRSVLEDVGYRHVVFSNRADDETKNTQVFELLNVVDNLVSSNTPPRFKHEVVKTAEAELKQKKLVEDGCVVDIPPELEAMVMDLLLTYFSELAKHAESSRVQESKSICSVM